MNDLKLVLVEWLDSSRGDGWVSVDSVDAEPHTVTSVGWVVMENDAVIVIAPHHSPETDDAKEQICGHMKIPKCAVVATRIITELCRRVGLHRTPTPNGTGGTAMTQLHMDVEGEDDDEIEDVTVDEISEPM